MKLAVVSDLHVMGPNEYAQSVESVRGMGRDVSPFRGKVRRGLNRFRDRYWHWDAESRQTCFLHALEKVADYNPDWIIANGDYGGDHKGIGLSDDHTFESVSLVVESIRATFPDRALFIFGDHDIGKYNTVRRDGGIRLLSLIRGEEELGISSFWHQELGVFHLIGVNSTLLTLHLFLPEALDDEIEEWEHRRREHIQQIRSVFAGLPEAVNILLFCHDPSALAELAKLSEVNRRTSQIAVSVVGHLHAPGLLRLTRIMRHFPVIKSRYPIARIITHSAQGARSWKEFKPVVCPSTYGIGHHVSGGVLFIEKIDNGRIHTYQRPITV